MALINNKIITPLTGMNQDSNERFLKKDEYRFAYNIVNKRKQDLYLLSNEPQFEQKEIRGRVLIGKCYVGNNQWIIFLSDKVRQNVEIHIYDVENDVLEFIGYYYEEENWKYLVDCTFNKQRDKRYIYFTNGNTEPKFLNIDEPDDYYLNQTTKLLDINKITLLPIFEFPQLYIDIEYGGKLKPGSYNFAIQYLDDNYNETSWIYLTQVYKITDYNENLNPQYSSGNLTDGKDLYVVFNKKEINKRFKIKVYHGRNINYFKYYRIAVLYTNINSENIERVVVSPEKQISGDTDYFYYSGINDGFTTISEQEVMQNKVYIKSAYHIEQFYDRLILASIKDKDINYCGLQKFVVNNVFVNGKKVPLVINDFKREFSYTIRNYANNLNTGHGLMPGEVYAFGVVFIFKDGSVSPVFHIPYNSNADNFEEYIVNNYIYPDDGRFGSLGGQNIKHYKVSENINFDFDDSDRYNKVIGVRGVNNTNVRFGVTTQPNGTKRTFYFKLTYSTIKRYNPEANDYEDINYDDMYGKTEDYRLAVATANNGAWEIDYVLFRKINNNEIIDDSVRLYYWNNGSWFEIPNIERAHYSINYNYVYYDTIYPELVIHNQDVLYNNYDIRQVMLVVGKKDEDDYRIIDTAILNNIYYNNDRLGISNFYKYTDDTIASKSENIFYIISPKLLYEKRLANFNKIKVTGFFYSNDNNSSYGRFTQQNVLDGTSSNGVFFGLIKTDSDGMDLGILYNFNAVNDYQGIQPVELSVEKIGYLAPATQINIDNKTLFNISLDQSFGYVKTSENFSYNFFHPHIFLGLLINDRDDIHGNLDTIEYRMLGNNAVYISASNTTLRRVFYEGTENYISLFNFNSSNYLKTAQPRRWGETIANIATFITLAAGAIAIEILTAGTGTPLIVAAVGAALAVMTGTTLALLSQIQKEIENDSRLFNLVRDLKIERNSGTNNVGKPDWWENDDIVIYMTQGFIGVPLISTYNRAWSLKPSNRTDSQSLFFGENMNEWEKYVRNKYLFRDGSRENSDDDNQEVMSLRPIINAELYEYNKAFLRSNTSKLYAPLLSYYKCGDTNFYPNRIMWSNRRFSEDRFLTYRSFLANNYKDINVSDGNITDILTFKDNLYVFTDRSLLKFPRPLQEKMTTELTTYIGTGEFLSLDPIKFIDDPVISGGTIYKMSILKLKNSVIYVTTDDTVIMFNANKFESISNNGMNRWFTSRALKRTKFEYEYTNNRDQTYISAYDPVFNRVLITQRDFREEWNYGFTVSFSLNTGKWISSHYYLPVDYIWDVNNFIKLEYQNLNISKVLSFDKMSFTKFNQNFIVDFIISNYEGDYEFNDVEVYTDVFDIFDSEYTYTIREYTKVIKKDVFFDKVLFYNSYQCSGFLDIDVRSKKNANELWMQVAVDDSPNRITAIRRESYFNMNRFRDYVKSYRDPIFAVSTDKKTDKHCIIENISYNQHWQNHSVFRDTYLGVRLIKEGDNIENANRQFLFSTVINENKISQ